MSNLIECVGLRVRALRTAAGLQQKELAAAIRIHSTAINHLEAGRKLPHIEKLLRICTFFHISPNELLEWDDDIGNRNPGHMPLRSINRNPRDVNLRRDPS